METEELFRTVDYKIIGKTLIVKYSRLDYIRHETGFDQGVLPFFQQCRQKGVTAVVLDMEETEHIESLTLGTIIKFKKEFSQLGMEKIRIANPPSYLVDLFETQNLDRVFGKPCPTVEDALKEINAPVS